MSVNGQDPRSNVYLLDGTLQNDFTNGPAGSAAGTALGIETIRSSASKRTPTAPSSAATPVGRSTWSPSPGANSVDGSLYRVPSQRHVRRAQLLRRRREARVQAQPVRRHASADRSRATARSSSSATRDCASGSARAVSTVVPDENARSGILLPMAARSAVNPAVRPYLDEYPARQRRRRSATASRATRSRSIRRSTRISFRGGSTTASAAPPALRPLHLRRCRPVSADRLSAVPARRSCRATSSSPANIAASCRRARSTRSASASAGRRIGQNVEANTSQPLPPFVAGRDIDRQHRHRRHPAVSGRRPPPTCGSSRTCSAAQSDLVQTRGRHLIKVGALVERYQDNMVNPTFSLGIYTFADLQRFLRNRPATLRRPDSRWCSSIATGASPCSASTCRTIGRLHPRRHAERRAALRVHDACRGDIYGRDSALPNLTESAPTVGPLYENPTYTNLSPRLGVGVGRLRRRPDVVRGGLRALLQHQQPAEPDRDGDEPAGDAARRSSPTRRFPTRRSSARSGNSIRPVQWDLDNPRVHVWNVNVQRELLVRHRASRRLRRVARQSPAAQQRRQHGALPHHAPTARRSSRSGRRARTPAFSTIELKSSDGDSWYNALIVRRAPPLERSGLSLQSSYTLVEDRGHDAGLDVLLRRDQRHDDGVSRVHPGLQQGTVRLRRPPQLGAELHLADARSRRDCPASAGAILDGWQFSGIGQMRSGNPLTVFVAANRSRSQWAPSLGPGIGRDRPSYAPGYGPDNAVVGRAGAVVRPGGVRASARRHLRQHRPWRLHGPDFRTLRLWRCQVVPWSRSAAACRDSHRGIQRAQPRQFRRPALTVVLRHRGRRRCLRPSAGSATR